MLGAFAEFEHEVIIDRVISGMERKAAKGEWTHGPRPYGYVLNSETQRLEPHPEEAPVVSEIFRLYPRTGLGTRAIAEGLNAQGKRTKSGGLFSGHTVIRMLANRLYRDSTFSDFASMPIPPIHLIVSGSRVIITGVVGNQLMKQKAESIIRSTPGVLSVESRLRIE